MRISSVVMPFATSFTTSETVIRMPRMQALPAITRGSKVIRSNIWIRILKSESVAQYSSICQAYRNVRNGRYLAREPFKSRKKLCQILAKCWTQLATTWSKLRQIETRDKSVPFLPKSTRKQLEAKPGKTRQ